MNNTIALNNDLKMLIKESIREALAEERINLYHAIIPPVNKKELSNIEKLYGNPERYSAKDFEDKTSWLLK